MFTQSFRDVGSVMLNVAVGPANGSPLLLLHGVLRGWRDFAPLWPALAPRWQLHAVDLRGHGQSGRSPGSYRVTDHAGDGIALVRQLPGSVVIFGHSLGYITTDSVYRDDTNLSLIVYSLLGGMGTLFGPVIGAFALVFVTQVLLGRLLDFHLFATGLLLVILVLAAPGGVIGTVRSLSLRRRATPVAAE